MTSGTGETLTYNYDGLRRLSGIDSTESISDRVYEYHTVDEAATTQVKSLTYSTLKGGYSFLYTYDAVGNIASYELSCVKSSYSQPALTYEYDAQGQLTKVNRNGTTLYSYTYDGFGNIKTANGIEYTYGNAEWRDLLTAYGDELIIYEGQTLNGSTVSGTPVSGNPTSYYNGTRWAFTWAEGRNLATSKTSTGTEDVSVTYAYDHNSLRTNKTVVTQTYHVHSYSETVTIPTCTVGGFTTYTCDCGHSYVGNETAATGHTYTSTVVGSTCTSAGYTVYTCTVCGYSYQDNASAETGHSYVSVITDPTCTEAGYTTYTCSVCGHSYQDNTTPAAGHTGVFVNTVFPTCTKGGCKNFRCSVCNETYSTDHTPALGHNYFNNVCRRCGFQNPESELPIVPIVPPGHDTASVQGASVTATSNNTRVLETTVTENHEYTYASGKLLREVITTTTTADGQTTTHTDILDFFYDASGTPYALTYNNGSTIITYYYITNLQGDVIRLVDVNGNTAAYYEYDPYGKIIEASGSHANINLCATVDTIMT